MPCCAPTRPAPTVLLACLLGAQLCGLGGCAALKAPFSPPVAEYPHPGAEPGDTLVLMIAPAGDSPDALRERDMIQSLREAGCRCDVKVIYYTGPAYALDSLTGGMHEDVVVDAGHRYRQRVWVGISAGGMAALEMARKRPRDVDVLVLVSPYLGSERIVSEIERAGGLKQWLPQKPVERVERTWCYVQGYANGSRRPRTVLMFGEQDLYANAHRMMASVLDRSQVRVAEGNHEWPTFRSLWEAYLRSDPGWLSSD